MQPSLCLHAVPGVHSFIHKFDRPIMMQRVLVLGSGFTVRPLIELITREGTIAVTVGERVECMCVWLGGGGGGQREREVFSLCV